MPSIRVGDTELFYQEDDFADAWAPHDTVFMQHGLVRNSNFWRPWVPTLAREYRVIRMDARGCGQSADPGRDYVYTTDGWVKDFIGFLDAMKIEKVHYIGESVGGIIGAASAAAHPARFHSLTLVSTPIRIGEDTDKRLCFGYSSQTEAFEKMGLEAWWLGSQEPSRAMFSNPAQDEYLAREFARTPVHVAGAIARWVVTARLADILPKITVPTMVLSPGLSPITTAEQQREFASLIPTAKQKVYQGAAHGMYYQMPDTLAKDALEYIRSMSSNAGRKV